MADTISISWEKSNVKVATHPVSTIRDMPDYIEPISWIKRQHVLIIHIHDFILIWSQVVFLVVRHKPYSGENKLNNLQQVINENSDIVSKAETKRKASFPHV